MKSIKNKLLITIALATTAIQIMPHGGGGGFGGGFMTGAVVGGLTTAAITSGSRRSDRDPAYYDYQDRKAQRVEINKEIRRHRNEINDHKKEQRKLDSNKKLDDATRESKKNEHKSAIADLEQMIKDLQADLRNLF